MPDLWAQIITAVVSGLIGGTITGVAAFAAIRVEIRWHRRDIDDHHRRITQLEEKVHGTH